MLESNWIKRFDEKFYRDKNRVWMSRSGESYGSEVPQMGRGELFRFFETELKLRETETLRELLKDLPKEKEKHDCWDDGFCPECQKADVFNTAIKELTNKINERINGK